MIALSTLSVICGCAAKKSSLPAAGYKVVVWEKGVKTEVKSQTGREQVREAVSGIVEHSDDMLKLIVTNQRIKEITKECTCLEIMFASPLTSQFGKTESSFSRILIPVNTDSSVQAIVFYLGDSKTYFTPPGVSRQGKADLNNLTELLGITFKDKTE